MLRRVNCFLNAMQDLTDEILDEYCRWEYVRLVTLSFYLLDVVRRRQSKTTHP